LHPHLLVQHRWVQQFHQQHGRACIATGLERGSGADAAASLACYYPLSKDRTLRADRRLTAPHKAEYKWWPDGYEPLYYVVTPRVSSLCCAGDTLAGRPRTMLSAGTCVTAGVLAASRLGIATRVRFGKSLQHPAMPKP
jgi:hypothetical protein